MPIVSVQSLPIPRYITIITASAKLLSQIHLYVNDFTDFLLNHMQSTPSKSLFKFNIILSKIHAINKFYIEDFMSTTISSLNLLSTLNLGSIKYTGIRNLYSTLHQPNNEFSLIKLILYGDFFSVLLFPSFLPMSSNQFSWNR